MQSIGDYLILDELKKRPGYAYITPDRKAVYALAGEDNLVCFTGPDFSQMTDVEINQAIVNTLS